MSPTGQLLVLDELVSDSMAIDQFSDEVLAHSSQHYSDMEFIDVGDPAGTQRAQTDEKTCFQILHTKKVNIMSSEQDPTLRWESVRKPLSVLMKGGSQFVLSPKCKRLRKGFQGRYQFKRVKISGSEERFQDKADKNEYSHPHDALQYVCVQVFGNALKAPLKSTPLKYPNKGYI